MKYLNFYNDKLGLSSEDKVFEYFIEKLKPSNTLWSYFVNWEKVFFNTQRIEVGLNILNYLIGKENFDQEFKFLVKQNPEIIEIIPALVVRDGANTGSFQILVDYGQKKLVYEHYDFSSKSVSDEDIDKYLLFLKETGFKEVISSQKIKNLVDYMVGVEAGLDSNGRKNRSGHSMEDIVGFFIADYCSRNNFEYIKEATAKIIKAKWGLDVPVDKSKRRYDYVVFNGVELVIFETNFYGGVGSKLKSTAGEYKGLFDILKNKHKFVWITDGNGWRATTGALREVFDHNDYIFNLEMIENGILDDIFNI